MPIEKLSAVIEAKIDKASFKKSEDDIQGFQERLKSQRAVELRVSIARAQSDLIDFRKQLKITEDRETRVKILSNIKETQQEITQLNRQLNNLTRTGNEAQSVLGKNFDSINSSINNGRNVTGSFTTGILGIGGAVSAIKAGVIGFFASDFVGSIIGATAKMENLRLSISTLVGDTEKAKQVLGEIKTLSEQTGKSEISLGGGARTLLSQGFDPENVTETLKSITLFTAATGQSEDALKRISIALGQIKASGTVAKEELNQLIDANVPVAQILTEKLGLTAKEVKNIGDLGLDSEIIIKALLEGMEDRSITAEQALGTITGQTENISTAFQNAAATIGEEFAPALVTGGNVGAKAIKRIGGAIKGFIVIMKIAAFAIIQAFVVPFQAAAASATNTLKGLSLYTKGAFNIMSGAAGKFAADLVGFISDSVNDAIGSINGFVQDINDTFGSTFKGITFSATNPLAGLGSDLLTQGAAELAQAAPFFEAAGTEFGDSFSAGLQASGEEIQGILDGYGEDIKDTGEEIKKTSGLTAKELEDFKKKLEDIRKNGTKGKKDGSAAKAAKEAEKERKAIEESIRKEALQNRQDSAKFTIDRFKKVTEAQEGSLKSVKSLAGEYDNLKKKYEETGKKGREEIEGVQKKIDELKKDLATITSEGQISVADRVAEIRKEVVELNNQLLAGGSAEEQLQRQKDLVKLQDELAFATSKVTDEEIKAAEARAARNQTQVLLDEIAVKKAAKEEEIKAQEDLKLQKETQLASDLSGIQAQIDSKLKAIQAEIDATTQQKERLKEIEGRYTQFLMIQAEARKRALAEVAQAARDASAALSEAGLQVSGGQVQSGGKSVTINNNISTNVDAESTIRKLSNIVK